MKIKRLTLLLIVFVLCVLFSCEKEDPVIKVTSVSVNVNRISITEGNLNKLYATISPENATNKNVTWKSNNAAIVSVDKNGEMVAKTAGVATITVTTEEGNKTATCEVTVEPKIILVTSIVLNLDSLELVVGDKTLLIATIEPEIATNKNVTWKSSNESVVSVDQRGEITANKSGNSIISVTSELGNITATCTVIVQPKIIAVTDITLNNKTLTIVEGKSEKLSTIIEPENASNKNVTWKSGNSGIATVDSEGNVFGVNEGNTTITVTTEDGNKTASCDITVMNNWLKLSQESILTSGARNNISINIDASEDWFIHSKPDWITVTTSSSNGGNKSVGSVEVSVSDYSGSEVFRSGEIIFTLNGEEQTAILTVDQYNFPYVDGDYVKVQSSTRGNGIDLVFLGDGYTIEDIGKGAFLNNLTDAIEHFFDIEPFRTYRNYFDVYIVYAFSEESGISDHKTIKNTKFSSKYEDPNTTSMTTNNAKCFEYALKAPLSADLTETLITVITNSARYAGTNMTYSNGMAISIVPVSNYPYPYDFRGVIQHEAAGHGFGKLADEYFTSNTTIPTKEKETLKQWQQWGFFLNVDLTNDLNTILWRHFIGEPNYSYVGAYEGSNLYAFGVWRSEVSSMMINNIAYINAPSRELIVKRIKKLAGETFSFDEFKEKDVRETHALTRSASVAFDPKMLLPPPILIKVK